MEEIEKVRRKLKRGKTMGNDGIPNETWLWGGEGLRRAVGEVCQRVWRRERFPDSSRREDIIVPIAKKRGRKG